MSIRRWVVFALLLSALLFLVGKAAADYLGPDRTRTVTTEVCKVVLLECAYVPSKELWKYVPIEDWMCSNEGKPWQSYPDHGPECWSGTAGEKYWERRYVVETSTVTYPEATIHGALNGCTVRNGWCVTSPLLSLTANEPVSGYQILLIEGTRNGEVFACQSASCDVPLLEGENTFTFWALSSWGDSSRMGNLSARVDTQPPQVQGELSGTPGEAGWYVSPVSVSASASDPQPGSGLQALTYSLDGGAWTAYAGPITVSDGVHTITFRAEDVAGHVAEASASAQVDTQPPVLQTALEGEQVNGWYLSRVVLTASATDGLSGLARIEYALDGGGWQVYSAPMTVGDGQHSLHVRALDMAGNVSEAASLTFQVDGTPPRILLPEAWYIWESGEVTVRDAQSGLSGVEIEIRDPQGRWRKVSRAYEASGERFTTTITWDRRFADGTLAPIGTYDVVVKAFDCAGNMQRATGQIVIPAPNVTPTPLSTRPPEPGETTTAQSGVTTTVASSPTPSPSSSLPASPAFTPTQAVVVSSFQSSSVLSVSPSVSSGSSSAVPLFGAAALAAIATATGVALAAKRRRKEEEREQAERVRAAVEAKNAALEAARRAKLEALKVRNWLMGKAMLEAQLREAEKAGVSQGQIAALRQTCSTKGLGAALTATAVVIRLLVERNRAQSQNPQPSSSGSGGKGLASLVPQPYSALLTPADDDPPTFWDKLKQLWNTFWNWLTGQTQPATTTPSPTLPPPQVFVTRLPLPTITPSPTSTPIPYQQYKTIGPLTEWELKVGGQVAYNAHQLLAQANQFYFWGTGTIENNQYPPLAGQNLSQPMPTLSPETRFSWPGLDGTTIPDVYEYTRGRTPFVCGDVVDWAYFMAGHDLQTVIDNEIAGGFVSQSSAYPGNRWTRSAYGYERMFQLIRLGGLEGKSQIWNVQTKGNNYSFTSENVPELGDILVTKTSSDLQDPNAGHVVLVAEVHGLTPDQIIIIEGNPDDGTIVKHTLEELKNRIPGLTYIIYGHPNLTPAGTP